ncbi:protein mono-ADP-ribosyltransferase PARP12 [Gadus morhua]|uniref:protein mono-ADP-ribosyltransferase PARP12 n=1 Tax=Gadus morhua TaxID=8049 RepID=UPI0011B5E1C6|nr:protein mono-ADP-ribosyltransferase PARP12-like [Gadus morhua]
MTRGLQKVRRLSSASSVLQPTFLLTTEWLWYWEDEHGNWNQYDSPPNSSTELEQKFQNDPQEVVEFTAGSQTYTLSLQDMIQTNKKHGTKRVVRRRPRFRSSADVQVIRTRRPPNGPPNVQTFPSHWDKTQVPETGYKKVLLQDSSEEYKEVETLFRQTMTDFDIVKIERIQNKSLWDHFRLQQEQMKTRNGGCSVAEKKLFHSTDSKYIDDICCSNYDWRICGTHGTAYGKGSYFARDASYSHKCTGNTSTVHSTFVSRVLVGHHTLGSAGYVRPPSKDGGDTLFYDSCADDILSPSIFVVFDQPQIYPEFLLTYKEKALAFKPNVQAFPSHWDKSKVPATGHEKVLLQDSSEEYKEVETLFRQTMTDFDIVKIERIQNKSLWDHFRLQQEQMKTRNGGCSVAEKKLFHSTDSKYIDDICCSNYDWRICGTHGTAYGKGSYFARDASYSHKCTGNTSTVHSTFVSRVLVGHHTLGMADYLRPPSKDGGDTLFYDSCVDNIRWPSIFVIFDPPQIYPEFLLTYKKKALPLKKTDNWFSWQRLMAVCCCKLQQSSGT